MNITRSRSFKANIGNYESFDVFVSVSVSHLDLGYTDDEWRDEQVTGNPEQAIADLRDLAEAEMEKQLRLEIERVNRLRDGEDAKSKSVLGHV